MPSCEDAFRCGILVSVVLLPKEGFFMKKAICLLLALLTLVGTMGVVAVAEENQINIVIDGVKDADYTDTRCFTYDYWIAYENTGNSSYEPVDPERMINTVWFNWDDESVYIYFQCESKDPLYKPNEGDSIPNFDTGDFFEIAQIYLDTAPSMEYYAPCIWAGQDGNGDYCSHMACACREGTEASAYRLMARANPAFDHWNDYFFTAAGMFMTYDEFCNNYVNRPGCEDLAASYAATHGHDAAAATFIDYETNTYGFEMKFPRAEGEEYFQFNIRTRVNETEWEDEGPELPYSLSFCPAWWMNSDELLEVWYEDYENVLPPSVGPIVRDWESLPGVDLLGVEHQATLMSAYNAYNNLSESDRAALDKAYPQLAQYFTDGVAKMEKLVYVANLGDVNEDSIVNANDALIALRSSVGKIELNDAQVLRADVNGDGKVDAKDALEMLQFTVGKRTQFTAAKALDL